MRKVFKSAGLTLIGFVGLIILAAVMLYASTYQRLHKLYSIPASGLTIPADAASQSRGQRLVIMRCAGCHGENLAGSILFQDANLGTITAANITGGRGVSGQPLQDEDLIRAIRHGIGQDGEPLLVMASESFYYLNDRDLGDMIAYLKSTDRVNNSLPVTNIKPLGVILIGAGAFGKLIAAEEIDHQAPRPVEVEPGVTAAYGNYLVRSGQCRTCHGSELSEGKDPDPKAPPAPSLTRGSEFARWTEEDFTKAIRTGITPGGRALNPNMPWMYIGRMTDDELKAVWLYLQTLPASQSQNQ